MQIDKDTLPKGWIKTTLNTVCVSIRDGTHTPPVRTDKGVPLLSGRNIENYGLNWDEKFSYISNHNFKQITKNNTISKNDILLTIVGTIGRVCVVETNSPFTVQRSVAILKLKNFIEPMFAKLYIQSPMFQQTLQRSAKGVAQKGVYLTELKAFEFMYPESLNEQQRISAQIESIFGEIDACRKRLEALQTKSGTGSLAQLKSSVLKQAFEGKLVPQDPNDEPASTLLEKIHSDIEFSFEKSQLPKGWLETKINYTSELIGGGTPSRKNLEYFDGDIVWLTPTEIPKYKITKVSNSREKITKLGLQKSSAKLIPKDAVLLTSRASVGYVAIAGTQVTTNQGFASFVCNDSTFNYYLAYWLWDNSAFLQ